MPSIRLIGALSLSLALIGGALWFRFIKIPPYSATLVSVQTPLEFASDDAFLKDFLSSSTTPARAFSTTTLSQEELLSRQIFTDYMSLKSQGQVSGESILNLADKYAEDILSFELSAPKVLLNQVVVVSDNEENMAAYGASLTAIRSKYKNLVAAQASGRDFSDISSPAFSSFMSATSGFFQRAANELLLVGVPVSLSAYHLDLINIYLENAEALRLVSDSSKNPAQAYASLNHYAKNTKLESDILTNIQSVLITNGIMFNSNI